MPDLLPCPFCGNEKVTLINQCIPLVVCPKCKAEGQWTMNAADSEKSWNTRPLESALAADVPRLEKRVKELEFENELFKARDVSVPTVTGGNYPIADTDIWHFCKQCQKWHPIGQHDPAVKITCAGDTKGT